MTTDEPLDQVLANISANGNAAAKPFNATPTHEFLAPLFLLGGLAIAGPVLFHLIRRNTREKFTFSSLMFLRADPPKVTRKSRLEDILPCWSAAPCWR